ncbi:MAG: hypothetical protein VX738_14865 [Planctomycetota bacterium]|nr:hypothetical protein [Planctomycetota bacterium]
MNRVIRWVGIFALILLPELWIVSAEPPALELPDVRVGRSRLAFNNGEHNAFTDLTWFQGHIYLTFRSCPDGHMVFPTSRILVMKSTDGKKWDLVHEFSVKNRDTRDPHFAILNDTLFIYTGTWYCGPNKSPERNLNQMVGYGVSTRDGVAWSAPSILEGTYGHYVWRTATFGDRIYMCARRIRGFQEVRSVAKRAPLMRSLILVSDDGAHFQPAGVFQETHGDETAFMFDSEGNVTAVGRRGRGNAELIRLSPSLKVTERVDLGRYIGGPFIRSMGDHIIVAGRNVRNDKPVTTVCWLIKNSLVDLCILPSGGDCSYPAMVQLCPGCMLVSYYSSHETDENGVVQTNIYFVELEY